MVRTTMLKARANADAVVYMVTASEPPFPLPAAIAAAATAWALEVDRPSWPDSEILREINIEEYRIAKMAVFAVFEALILCEIKVGK